MKTTQIDKVYNFLTDNSNEKGFTASMIAKWTRVPRANVVARISDLRNEGMDIEATKLIVNGKKKTYYRMAG